MSDDTFASGIVEHAVSDADRRTLAAIRDARTSGVDDTLRAVPDAPGIAYDDASVGGVPGVWCVPDGANPHAAVLYLHGGGYVSGSAAAFRSFAGQIAARCGVATFVVDYRIAPAHPFPAAVDDALAAYRGLVDLGRGPLALVGDSAGGGLALVTMRLAHKDDTIADARACATMSAWTDLALTGDSILERADADPALGEATLAALATSYLAGHDPRDERASPLYGDLTGAPLQLHVGTAEVLLDDTLRCVELARAAGTTATAHVWHEMPHVFETSVGALEAAGASLDIIGAFLRERLG